MAKPLLKSDRNDLLKSRLLSVGSPLRAVSAKPRIAEIVEESFSEELAHTNETLIEPVAKVIAEMPIEFPQARVVQSKPLEVEVAETPKAVTSPVRKTTRTKSRDILLDQEQDDVIEEIASIFRAATGTRPSVSNILRATIEIMKSHIPAIRNEAARVGELRRPSYSAGHNAVVKKYESTLAETIARGLRG